jgi:hypothetical protein
MSVSHHLKESVEDVKHPFDRKVAASMAVIAAVLSIIAVLGNSISTQAVLLQQEASDQWALFQAKSIRRYESDMERDTLAAMGTPAAQKASQEYAANINRYEKEIEEIRQQATAFQGQSHLRGLQARRLQIGEVFLQIAIVLASLAILTRRNLVWGAGLISATIGAAVAITAEFVHL